MRSLARPAYLAERDPASTSMRVRITFPLGIRDRRDGNRDDHHHTEGCLGSPGHSQRFSSENHGGMPGTANIMNTITVQMAPSTNQRRFR